MKAIPLRSIRIASLMLLLPLLALQLCFAQTAWIAGSVTETGTGEVLQGVKVTLDNSSGALTDSEGRFTVATTTGLHHLTFTYEGYQTLHRELSATSGDTLVLQVELLPNVTDLDIVVISGSRYEKKLSDEVVSIDVVKPYLVQNTNATDLADVTKRVPGVSIVDGQASIRGGSGYAYGAGSRVQVLVDDLPLLTADLSEVRWNFVPVENIEQIEVIKGASSALYGSAAMNGVINVRTGWASEKPSTQISVYQTLFDNPRLPEMRWWGLNESPFSTGFFASHRRKIGNLDLVAGGHYNQSRSYLQYADNNRGRLNFKTRYQSKKVPGLSFGINANGMWEKFGRFFLWAGSGDSAYIPLAREQRERFVLVTVDPYLSYLGPKGVSHQVRTRMYYIRNYIIDGSNVYSRNLYGEYQFMKVWDNNLRITAGAVANSGTSFSHLFSYKKFSSFFGAAYAQAEKKWGRLTAVMGGRYEVNSLIDRVELSKPTMRGGLSYKAGRSTFLRGSFGQSYRFPSLMERYIQADLLGLNVFANPDLVPERGASGEVGIKQGVRLGNWQGFVDLALFCMEFKEMTEFVFVIRNGSYGFQTQNITRARIAGAELTAMGEGNLGPVKCRIYGGYSFTFPGDLERDTTQRKWGTFLSNMVQSISNSDSLMNSILRYRYRNTFRMDMEFEYKRFMLGGNVNYYSNMEKIDEVFEIFPGVRDYREQHPNGSMFFEMRGGCKLNDHSSLNLVVKNLTNLEYSLRPALMEAPRSFTLQYKYNF